jgi:sodium/hydrogen antiporter
VHDFHTFEVAVAVLGALLVVGALLSGVAKRSFLSMTALFVLVGFALGDGGAELLEFDASSDFVRSLAVVALILILFRDGLEVEEELLQADWHLPLRKLVFAMPVTAALIAVVTYALTDLDWTESFLLGALLSPTDPVLSSAVVTNPRVPRRIRHSLNLESGLNDGLALPAVIALLFSLDPGESDFTWWTFVLQDLGVGLAAGALVGFAAARLMPQRTALGSEIGPHQKSLYALGVAFAAYGVAVLPPEGNGLIAVFVCAIVLGILRPDLREAFERRSEDIIEVVKLGIFVVFGSLLTANGLFEDGLAAVGIAFFALFVARPAAVHASLAGTDTAGFERWFMSWFGPKGVATMTFSLLVLSQAVENGGRIFNIAALTVFLSIVLHGATDTAGVSWIERRSAAAKTRK